MKLTVVAVTSQLDFKWYLVSTSPKGGGSSLCKSYKAHLRFVCNISPSLQLRNSLKPRKKLLQGHNVILTSMKSSLDFFWILAEKFEVTLSDNKGPSINRFSVFTGKGKGIHQCQHFCHLGGWVIGFSMLKMHIRIIILGNSNFPLSLWYEIMQFQYQ